MDAAQLCACRNYYIQFLKKLAPDKRRFVNMRRYGNLFEKVVSFENLLATAKKAFRGKKDKVRTARFYFGMEKELLCLRDELGNKTYMPRPLRKFQIREPKVREIGASDFPAPVFSGRRDFTRRLW